MIKRNQDGAANGVVVSLILCLVLLIGAVVFAGWAYSSRQDYKDNSDTKAAAAADEAAQKESALKDKQFAETSKSPLKTYKGPDASGSLQISYPKTWSGYVDDSSQNSAALDGYFNPGVVPSINNQNSVFALRIKVTSQTYAQTLQSLQGQQQSGQLHVSAYALPKLPKVVGVKADGQLNNQKKVSMVILPLRSQTIQIWTEGDQYLNDFNQYILPNFTFSP
jgi:hypothetical protein